MIILVPVLVGACGVAGLALLLLGVRGRRVDDHPICRGCAFDLVGVYPAADRCPECGGDLSGARAVRPGTRRRRLSLLWAAAPCLLVGLGGGGFLGWAAATSFNWYKVSPDWLLESMAESAGGSRQQPALAELAGRLAAGDLAEARAARLVERGLAIQADSALPWRAGWGDVIDAAARRERLTQEQINAYLTNSCDFSIRSRERVHSGDEVQVGTWVRPVRAGSATHILVAMRLASITLDGTPVSRAEAEGFSRLYLNGPGSSGGLSNHTVLSGEAGEHELRIEVEAHLSLLSGAPTGAMFSDPDPGGDVMLRRALTGPLEIVSNDAPLATLVDDPSLEPAIRRALQLMYFRASGGEGDSWLEGSISADGLPIACVFDAFVRVDGTEHAWGSVVLPAGGGHGTGLSGRIAAPIGNSVDVVLRSSERTLLTRTELETAWQGEIVIEGVPVSRGDSVVDGD